MMVLLLCRTWSYGQQVIIKGTLTGDLKGHNKMYMYTRTSHDSAEARDGHYTFTFSFTGTVFKVFLPEYVLAQKMMYQPFGILIDQPGTYTINTNIEQGMQSSQVKGSEATNLYRQFEQDQSAGYKKINTLVAGRFGNDWYRIGETDPAYPALQKAQDSLHTVYLLPLVDQLVSGHPDSYAAPFVLNGARELLSLQQKEAYYDKLSGRMKQSDQGKQFYYFIQGIKNSGVGSMVQPFALPDPNEHPLNFADLKGKYVLIDFWASWCSPCRQSFPHLRDMYAAYKGKNFEIYSISIDQDKKAWLKAVGEENNPWLQALDTKNISQKGFAVSGVPSTFLIGPDGRIMEKQVGFDEKAQGPIDKKLEALFGAVDPQKPAANAPATEKKVIPATKMTSM